MDRQLFSCKVCFTFYDKVKKMPKMLQCGHTFCDECLCEIMKASKYNCPLCKKIIDKKFVPIINYEIVSNLPENNLKEILCQSHFEEIHFFCKTCKKDVCQKCLLDNHLSHQLSKSCNKEITKLNINLNQLIAMKDDVNKIIEKNNKEAIDSFEKYSKEIRYMLNCILLVNSIDSDKLNEIDKKINLIKHAILDLQKDPGMFKNYNFNELELKEDELNLKSSLTELRSLELRDFNHFIKKQTLNDAIKLFKKAFSESIITDSTFDDLLYLTVEKENQNLFTSIRINSPLKMSDNLFRVLTTTDRKDFLDGKLCNNNFYGLKEEHIGFNSYIPDPTIHYQTLYYLDAYLSNNDSSKFRKALDIGCGSGFMTVCISKLLGSNSITFGLDHIGDIVKISEENVRKKHLDYITDKKIKFIIGDALVGYPISTEYDIIHFGVGYYEVPFSIKQQLAVGGIIFIPIGKKNELKKIQIIKKIAENKYENFELVTIKSYDLICKADQLKGIEYR